jgi:hypothetical protein
MSASGSVCSNIVRESPSLDLCMYVLKQVIDDDALEEVTSKVSKVCVCVFVYVYIRTLDLCMYVLKQVIDDDALEEVT